MRQKTKNIYEYEQMNPGPGVYDPLYNTSSTKLGKSTTRFGKAKRGNRRTRSRNPGPGAYNPKSRKRGPNYK
jgi:hypothetical protein